MSANKTVLVVTHVIPYPPSAGNEIRLLNLLKWLRMEGYFIVLLLRHDALPAKTASDLMNYVDALHTLERDSDSLPDAPSRAAAAKSMLKKLLPANVRAFARNLKTFAKNQSNAASPEDGEHEVNEQNNDNAPSKDWFAPERLVERASELCQKFKPSIMITQYIFAAPVFQAIPEEVLKLIDTIDVFSRKDINVIKYGLKDGLACTPDEEREQLLKCDVVIAIQSVEAAYLAALVPDRTVVTVSMDLKLGSQNLDQEAIPGRILVVASDNHLNTHGVTNFMENALPAIRKQCPAAHLRLVGKIVQNVPSNVPGVEAVGWVEDLDDEYRAAQVVINPTIAGTGLKVKSVEALCRGKCLLTWPNGVEGVVSDGEPPFVLCNSWNDFVVSTVELLNSEQKRTALQRRAVEYSRVNFASESIYSGLREILLKHETKLERESKSLSA